MKKSLLMATILMVSFFSGYSTGITAPSGDVVLPPAIRTQIESEASKPASVAPIDLEMAKQPHQNIRTWVSRSIDLNKAQKRPQTRFKRTSYIQELKEDVLRLPTERLNVANPPPRSVMLQQPMQVVYREGEAYSSFDKFKETPQDKPLAEREAVALAKDFLVGNKFILETADDKIGNAAVMEQRINEEKTGQERADRDYLVQQDVVFERMYRGKPVINSKIIVGLQPDTKDIVLLKHIDWSPIKNASHAREVRLPVASTIEQRLVDKIKKNNNSFKKATVAKMISGWFQTGDSMLPVAAFLVDVEYQSSDVPVEQSVEVINLSGADDVFSQGRNRISTPERAPR